MSYFPSSKELYTIYPCIANNTWKIVVMEQQCALWSKRIQVSALQVCISYFTLEKIVKL